MERKMMPGTVMPYTELRGGMFEVFKPMILAADGLTLGQVAAITGLESSTIQNWVKRGFVAHPVKKKYYEQHLARVLIIAMLRDCMKIEDAGELLWLVNGDATDRSDDIISEEKLYDCLCEVLHCTDTGTDYQQIVDAVNKVVSFCKLQGKDAARRLKLALLVMINAYYSNELKYKADLYFAQLKE